MKIKSALLAAAALFSISSAAQAAIIPTLEGVTDNLDGTWTFSYEATLAGDQGLVNGSRVVIVDFVGYVDGSVFSTAANWVASVEDTTAGLLVQPGETDEAGLKNLVFTWTGGDYNKSGGPFADVDFNSMGASSTYAGVALTWFTAAAVTNTGSVTGLPAYNVGQVSGPVPEPATWAMMIVGFLGAGSMLRTARRKDVFAAA